MSTETEPLTIPAGWDLSKVIPGQAFDRHELEDDIAPGVMEVVPDRTPVLYRAGSTAMTVAAVTGKVVGLTARGAWWVAKPLAIGSASLCYLGYRYIRAHDVQEVLGGMTKKSDLAKVEQTRRSRWKLLGWGAAATAALNVAGWWALVAGAGMTALDWSWAIPPAVTTLAAATIATLYGRYRLATPGLPAGQIVADEDQDDGTEPFPLAWCTNGEQVQECVERALAYEGIATRACRVIGQRGSFWEIDVVLKGSTVGKVNAVADQLDTHFNVARGATMIEPDMQESAHLILRLRTGNPFADMPNPALHAPNSLDISAPHNFGRCMDGSLLDLVLEGLRVLVIGVSGSAKTTGVLRDLAEVVTACHNAIALDLDPVKDGLREFEGVMAAPPIRGQKDCEKWLGYLVKMAEARNVVRNRLGMGDTWIATAEHPAIFPFVDEFIYLSQTGKELFIQLLRLGKQVGIYPIAAGQDATSDAMGDAIADTFTLRIMLASRAEDIRLVFGNGAAAAGFRPDRLEPAQTKDIKNDAGRSYLKGAGYNRPLLYGWNEHSNAAIKRAVADRKLTGRPTFDRDTLAAAGLLHLADGGNERHIASSEIVADVIAVMANEGVDRMRTEKLLEALADHDEKTYGGLAVADLRKLLKDAGAGSPITLGALDGMENPRGYKLETLTAITR